VHIYRYAEGRRQVNICGVDRHGERAARAYNRGLEAERLPSSPPPVKLVGSESISGATSSKSGVDMSVFTCIGALGTPAERGPTGVDKGGPAPPMAGQKDFFVKIE